MRWTALALVCVLGSTGCEDEQTPPEPAAEPAAPSADRAAEAQVLERTRGAAKKLGGTLKARLRKAMGEGGPPQAIDVCADEAQALTHRVAEETGVQVGRSSLRLRNPDNAPPDWVEGWLREKGERPAEGVQGVARVDDVAGEKRARVIAPIAVEGPCVSCHGPREDLPESVVQVLEREYPQDQAVGYAVGDLRGALWAEAPVP
ncbi:MAG: Tll0287-like domain-containing protein [Myxococcota bacterium]